MTLLQDALTFKIGAETGGISVSFTSDLKSNHGKVDSLNRFDLV